MMKKLFALTVLAGATWRGRIIGASGAAMAIGLAAYLSALFVADGTAMLLLAAPIGASAVLVFVVPSSPLAQPWPVIGGNIISAICGILVAQWIGATAIGAGVAVGLSILAMSIARCIHAPGGGTALLGILGGDAVLSHGLSFAFVPVGLNAALLVAAGLAFHYITGARYPNRAAPSAPTAAPFADLAESDIDAALAESGISYDVSRQDLVDLLSHANHHAAERTKLVSTAKPKRWLRLPKLSKKKH